MQVRVGRLLPIRVLISITLGILLQSNAFAVPVDFQVNGKLNSDTAELVAYRLAIGDCSGVSSVEITAGNFAVSLNTAELNPISLGSTSCKYDFTADGDGRLQPQATLQFVGQPPQVHIENFQREANKPQLQNQ